MPNNSRTRSPTNSAEPPRGPKLTTLPLRAATERAGADGHGARPARAHLGVTCQRKYQRDRHDDDRRHPCCYGHPHVVSLLPPSDCLTEILHFSTQSSRPLRGRAIGRTPETVIGRTGNTASVRLLRVILEWTL